MEIKNLQIEIVLTEMIAERNKIILQLNDQAVAQQKEIAEKDVIIAELKAKLEAPDVN